MNRLPIFGAGLRGRSAMVTAQHRLNVYADIQAVEDRTRIAFYGRAGLTQVMNFGADPSRGLVIVGDYLYSVHGYTLYRIASDYSYLPKGTLITGEGRIGICTDGQEIFMVDGTAGYAFNVDTDTFTTITDSDFPNGARTCTWQDGYFSFETGDEWQLSDIDSATSHDATRKVSAETIPDRIVRVLADDNVMLCGPANIEFWANTGTLDFPYSRLGGGSTLKVGLAARWSLVKYRDGVAFLGRTRGGGLRLFALSPGGGLQQLSSVEWETTIDGYDGIENATGLAYSYGGHDFYQINFASTSWMFDGALMSEIQTDGTRHRADDAIQFGDSLLVSDYEDGRIYELDVDVHTDDGATMVRSITSRHLFNQQPLPITDLWVEMETGVGTLSGQGEDPQVMLEVSRDGGRTWGSQQWESMGALGDYEGRIHFGPQGADYAKTFRLSVSDPVRFVLTGEGWVDG